MKLLSQDQNKRRKVRFKNVHVKVSVVRCNVERDEKDEEGDELGVEIREDHEKCCRRAPDKETSEIQSTIYRTLNDRHRDLERLKTIKYTME